MRRDPSDSRLTDEAPAQATASRQRSSYLPIERVTTLLTGHIPGSVPEFDVGLSLDQIADQACLATSATASAIALRLGDEIICRAATGPNAPDVGVSLNTGAGLSGACVRTRKVQYCDDTETDPRVDAEACRRLQVRSVLVVPLMHGEELAGIFEILSPQPHAFGHEDLQTLYGLARWIEENIRSSTERSAEKPIAAPVAAGAAAPAPPVPPTPAERSPIIESQTQKVPAWPTQAPNPPAPVQSPRVQQNPAPQNKVATRDHPEPPRKAPAQSTPERSVAPKPPVRAAAPNKGAQPPPPAHSSDRVNNILTVAVIGLALLLGWMLGRVGWHGPPVRQSQSQPSSSSASANTSSADPQSPPPEDSTASNAASTSANPGTTRRAQSGNAAGNNLVVFQNGKMVFRQRALSTNAADESATSDGADGETASPAFPLPWDKAKPLLVARVEPVYPEQARQLRIQGAVVLEVRVSKTGEVEELKLLSGDTQLATAAAAAIRQWRFKPFLLRGKPSAFKTRLALNFTLP